MIIRKANLEDCRSIAELALIAGEGMPAFFWEQSKKNNQEAIDVGMENLASETENFSYKNVHVAEVGDEIAGMILTYKLPEIARPEDTDELPDFIRPLIELEQCVPGSFYINMLAAFSEFRNQSVGTGLMTIVNGLARQEKCSISSVEVFSQNEGALRLYRRLGYTIIDSRPVIKHSCHPYTDDVLLLTRDVV